MAITYFGVGTTPSDNGAFGVNIDEKWIPVTPPASMQQGDLCLLFQTIRTTDVQSCFAYILKDGGQTWTSFNTSTDRNNNMGSFARWCVFNGTWSEDPIVGFRYPSPMMTTGASQHNDTGNTARSCQLIVFRPTSTSNTWALDLGWTGGNAPTGASHGIVAWTFGATVGNYLGFAVLHSGTDATAYSSLTGAGWALITPPNQFRNTQGTGMCHVYAYFLGTESVNTGALTFNLTASGGGNKFKFSMREV